jgi:hypothetical protein
MPGSYTISRCTKNSPFCPNVVRLPTLLVIWRPSRSALLMPLSGISGRSSGRRTARVTVSDRDCQPLAVVAVTPNCNHLHVCHDHGESPPQCHMPRSELSGTTHK